MITVLEVVQSARHRSSEGIEPGLRLCDLLGQQHHFRRRAVLPLTHIEVALRTVDLRHHPYLDLSRCLRPKGVGALDQHEALHELDIDREGEERGFVRACNIQLIVVLGCHEDFGGSPLTLLSSQSTTQGGDRSISRLGRQVGRPRPDISAEAPELLDDFALRSRSFSTASGARGRGFRR